MKLNDVSPLAGMVTGEGALGDLMRQGFGGAIPAAIARDAYDEKKKQQGMAPTSAMKKGGKVKASSASKRADGIAQRGKTRGRMV